MVKIKTSGNGVKLNVGAKSAYRSTNQKVRAVAQPVAQEHIANQVARSAPPMEASHFAAQPIALYKEHFNLPFNKVVGSGPYKVGPNPTPTSLGNPFVYYGAVSLVPADAETTVVSYVTANNQLLFLQGFQGCGDADAMYTLYVDNLIVAKSRTTPANLNAYLNLVNGTPIVQPGKLVKLTVTCTLGGIDFFGTVFGYYETF